MGQITKPNTFTGSTSISSSQVNDNFDTIYNEFNGSISSTNLATGAVSTAKIADGAVTSAKLATATITEDNLGANLRAGWLDLDYTPDTVTANGNRSYDLVFNSNDLTDTVSPGMRLQLTRTVTAPTQCADLEASSSQYFSKSSPAGMTFTDDFVVSAWIKLESYAAANMTIASRYNGTSGWSLHLTANTGQLLLQGFNASAANYSYVVSSQSIPIGKWVHVAAQLDMSAFTATTTTSYIMIDGLDVPATVARAGTNPTALVQAGNLEIGSANGGLQPFDGKLAQVWYSSAKITQANIKTLIGQGLTSALISANNIVSAYSLSNSITDLNTNNANNLTAQNSAVATNADSPFGQQFTGTPTGTTEYAIITQATFSTNTTITVQVPEGSAIPTSGGVSSVLYSTQKTPWGFIANADKWTVEMQYQDSNATTSSSYAQVGLHQLTVPVGSWTIMMDANMYASLSGNNAGQGFVALSTSTSALINPELGQACPNPAIASLSGFYGFTVHVEKNIKCTTATIYYQIFKRTTALTWTVQGSADIVGRILARCAYL